MARTGFVYWDRPGRIVDPAEFLAGRTPALQEKDLAVLDALLRYNFLTPHQARRLWLWSERAAQHRLARLHRLGWADRGRAGNTAAAGRPPSVYALSQAGFDLLRQTGHALAGDWADHWRPKRATGSQKLSVIHELGRNDVCIALLETARALGIEVLDWEGPGETAQKFLADPTNHDWQRIEPDAVILLDRWQPLMIEYERSGRDSKFQKKVRALRAYLVGRHWQSRYPREPWVVYAVPSGTGTQGVLGGSYGGMALQAGMTGARNYLFLDEEAWEQGTWMATTGDGTVANFWDVVLGRRDSRARLTR